jgi:3-methyladenine DNA glycosylase AlkC
MLLKEVYNSDFLQSLALAISNFDESFDSKNFLKISHEKDWEEKELKQRMRAITLRIDESFGNKSYRAKVEILKKAAPQILASKHTSLALIILPDFVEVFGVDDFIFSLEALEFFTEFGSSEFAVRKFLKFDEDRALEFFTKWTKSKNYHVRRLASEGCRPMLPWGEALISFKKNPAKILPILENLKFDKAEYVRKSIANNLNDISKNHPQVVLDLMQKWNAEKVDEKLIKHALRTLLKKGNKEALKIIGIKTENLSKDFTIPSFSLQNSKVKIAQDLVFDFTLQNHEPNNKIRLEYVLYFLRQNGLYSKKNFQITTKNFAKGVFEFSKKHSFRDLSTRKHYVGKHSISLVVNGIEIQKLQFDLKND